MTKFAGNCGFVTFTEEILNGNIHFLCSEHFIIIDFRIIVILHYTGSIKSFLHYIVHFMDILWLVGYCTFYGW